MNTYRTSSELYDERQNWQISLQEERESYVESYGDKAMTTQEDATTVQKLMQWVFDNNYEMQITRSTTISGVLNIDVYDIHNSLITGYVVDSLTEFYLILEDSEPELLK